MKQFFSRHLTVAALVLLLCAYAVPDFAMAAGSDWQALVDEHAALTKRGQHERALDAAHRALALAETNPDADNEKLAFSFDILGSTYSTLGQNDKALPLQLRALVIYEKILGPKHLYRPSFLNNLAITYGNLGQHDKALSLQLRALAIYEEALGPEHPDTALSLGELADTYRRLAQFDKALPLQQRVVTLYEKTRGPEDSLTVSSLGKLALSYSKLGQYDKALSLQQRVLTIDEKTLGPEHPNTAMSRNNLASTYVILGQNAKVLQLQQRALDINEKNNDSEHPNTAIGLRSLGHTLSRRTYDKALSVQQPVQTIEEKTNAPEHPDTATGLHRLADTLSGLAQYEKALPLQQRALVIFETTLGLVHPSTATSLNNLANTYVHLSQYDKALPLLRRALDIREEMLGPEHPDTAQSMNNLASAYGTLAQYDKALPLLQRSLAIFERTLGAEHPNTAWSVGNLGSIYDALAQYDKALPFQQRVLTIREQSLGPEHPDTAMALNNLADTLSKLFQYETALPLQQRALGIYEKTLGPEHPDTAWSLNNLALTYGALGQHDSALLLQQRVLAINEQNLGPEHTNTAASLNNLSVTYGRLAQYDKVLPLEQRALAIHEKTYGSAHPSTARSLENLAITFIRMGQPDLAIAFFKSAVNAHQNQREQVSRIDAPSLSSYTESVSASYQALAALLIDKGLLSDAQLVLDMLKENEQFEFIRRSSSADPRLTRIGYNANEQVWMSRYRQIADRLVALGAEEQALQKQAKLGLSAEQKQRQQDLAKDLRVAQTAFESFLKEMRESFASKGLAKAAEVSETSVAALGEIQGLLKGIGQDSVLLQYYVTDDKVGMLLTTPGVQLARSTNVSAKDLNRQIAAFRRLLRDPKSDAQKASQALYQLLVAPVAQDLEQAGAKTVMLSLDGALRYLPFAALHDGERYLAQRWNLPMYTSVTRNRLRDAATPQWQAAGLGVTRALGEFAALPAVKAEMRSIIKTGSGGILPGEVHLDDAFTALRFKDVSQRSFQLLHVASHFRFSPGTEVNSFLLLGDGQQLTLGDIRTQNYRFDNVDLLTLSACDTGLGGGRDAQGREIEGFGVIAQQQGAKAVLATLWPVADDSTSKLMAEMYRLRQDQQLTKIEALRQAQLSLLAQSRYAHPFYWAPFILMGNWK